MTHYRFVVDVEAASQEIARVVIGQVTDEMTEAIGHQVTVLPQLANSCLDKIRPDEPYFLFRAQDAFTPATVRFWFALARATLSNDRQTGVVHSLNRILDWQHAHPDLVHKPD